MKISLPVPVPLALALLLVVVEAAVMGVLAVLELFSLDGDRLAMGLTTTLFFAGYAVALLACARATWRRETWGRSPLVLAQLIQLGVAWSWFGGNPELSTVLAVVAAAVLAGIFAPASLRALEPSDEHA
ncbi:hypothetical protein [Nocardioides solisilvae]|uniref:hypothetical protein n=1 Tax=Nocardioides solisilvae TaxID=1542435 RepID=UPI000D7400D6|nr:hypothetical protein [Nocardioides solisilvae]